MADVVKVVPGFWFLAGATLVAALGEVAILLVSLARLARQARAQRLASAGDWQAVTALPVPSRFLEIIAALIPFGVAAAFVRAIHGARNLLVHAMSADVPVDEKATLASRAISGDMNATPMGLLAVTLLAVLASVAVSMAVGVRLRARGLRRAAALASEPRHAAAWLKFPGPLLGIIFASVAAFLVLGFGPIAQAGHAGIISKIKVFAAVATAPVEQKGPLFDRALDEASRLLDSSLVLSRVGIAIAIVTGAFLAWKFSATRARARMLGGAEDTAPKDRAGMVIACGTIGVAVAAFLVARPLRRENQLPWPPYAGGERLMLQIPTADLDGPDELERAPVIFLTPKVMGLDGYAWDAPSLTEQLATLRRNYGLLWPGQDYSGVALVICQADTPAGRLADALRAAVDGGSPHTTFGFLRRQETDRPLFGKRWRNLPSAARTTTVVAKADAESGATIIEVERFSKCATISKEIVTARRAGHEVALLLPEVRAPKARR